MRALVNCMVDQRLKLDERPLPANLEPDEVLLKMVASGVCGTDLKLVEGKISGAGDGVIMGHEVRKVLSTYTFIMRCSPIHPQYKTCVVIARYYVGNTMCGLVAYNLYVN